VWVDDKGKETEDAPVAVYVPPGESRVVRVPRPKGLGPHYFLRLKGDTHGFDNTIYFADERRQEKTVVYVGADRADDPTGLLYYLERVYTDTPRRSVHIVASKPGDALVLVPISVSLVIVTTDTSDENARALREYVRGGGTVLYVVTKAGRGQMLGKTAGATPSNLTESASHDVMLGEIKFDHPLFAALAGPQFNDFTKIHFWKHRHFKPERPDDWSILAKFEAGEIAIAEKTDGKGRLVVFTSGWHPDDSQLARSSKFVPLMLGLLEGRSSTTLGGATHMVFDRVPIPIEAWAGKELAVHEPDGTVATLLRGSAHFTDTAQPGLYTVDTADGPRSFAVNLDPQESKTAPLEVETLEQMGCRMASYSPKPLNHAELRQMYNAELENRQKIWRWLILAAIAVLIVETWLAGRRVNSSRSAQAEVMVA
jgi:hypothetical protein